MINADVSPYFIVALDARNATFPRQLLLKFTESTCLNTLQVADPHIADHRQYGSHQCDNKYIFPDCRHNQY